MKLRPDVQLWAHQRTEADFIKSHDETFLLAGCGTGKSLTVLTAIAELGYRRVLVVTIKAALRSVWEEEIERFTDGAEDVLVLDKGTAKEKANRLREFWDTRAACYVVVNYETSRLLPLSDYSWQLVVADESHRLKSHNSKQSEELAKQLAHVPHKVAMTGTAFEDRPLDLFGQVRFLEPVRNGSTWGARRFGSWSRFFEEYARYRTVDNIKIVTGYKNQRQLAESVADIFRFVDRDQVLDLPPVQHITRRVRLGAKHRKLYDELAREMALEVGEDLVIADNQLVLALRLHQVAGGFYQPTNGGNVVAIPGGDAKLTALEGLVEELGDEPFVVFTRFAEDVSGVRAVLRRVGVTSKVLVGGKDEHLDWRRGRAQALICNIQAGSTGINLTRAAYAIFFSTGYSNTDYTQACYRIDRPGQTRKVTFFHIIAEDTIDRVIAAMLKSKDKTASGLLKHVKEAS